MALNECIVHRDVLFPLLERVAPLVILLGLQLPIEGSYPAEVVVKSSHYTM